MEQPQWTPGDAERAHFTQAMAELRAALAEAAQAGMTVRLCDAHDLLSSWWRPAPGQPLVSAWRPWSNPPASGGASGGTGLPATLVAVCFSFGPLAYAHLSRAVLEHSRPGQTGLLEQATQAVRAAAHYVSRHRAQGAGALRLAQHVAPGPGATDGPSAHTTPSGAAPVAPFLHLGFWSQGGRLRILSQAPQVQPATPQPPQPPQAPATPVAITPPPPPTPAAALLPPPSVAPPSTPRRRWWPFTRRA